MSAEHQLIGHILTDNTLLHDLDLYIEKNDLTDVRAVNTLEAMRLLNDQGKELNIVTLSELNPDPENIRYLADCQRHKSGTLKAHAHIVREKAVKRRLGEVGVMMLEMANDAHTAIEKQIEQVTQLILNINNPKEDTLLDTKNQLERFTNDLQERIEAKGYIGLETPWSTITQALGGMNKGELYTVAARPGMGKTNFGLNLYSKILKDGKSCLYVSLEMTSEELLARIAADWANIDYSKFTRAQFEDFDWSSLTQGMIVKYKDLKSFIDDSSTQTMSSIRAKANRVKKQHGIDMIIIDHIGLIDHGYDNETQGLSKISRECKRIAKDLECPVVILSQLNRKCEERNDKRPLLSDLRSSGSIEQDSDAVIFLYRDEYYNRDSDNKGLAEIILAKVRKGMTGNYPLESQFKYCRFSETGRELKDEDEDDFGF